MPAVSDFAHPAQRGFMAGKSGEDHIININKLFYDSVKEKSSKLLFLLDTAKAFDSIDHSWIKKILARANFPEWFRNFVKGSLKEVKVSPFFGDGFHGWISIDRGVKQGCPLSPLLFIIAYDPLIHALSLNPNIALFAFADDIAIFTDSVLSITPSLIIISSFSLVSGLGINKKKSVVIPTGSSDTWELIQNQLISSPWPDLTIQPSGTHLGIIIGRDITLEDVWKGPLNKAQERVNSCSHVVKGMDIRILFSNTFVVSIFSYIALFFILPSEIWKDVKRMISKIVIPYNGGAFTYETLVCGSTLHNIKPALNASLLTVRSRLFNPSINYHDIPTINLKFNMHMSDHRDAAAADFWRSRHHPDGKLIPISPPTSSIAYKVFIEDVYLSSASEALGKKLLNFISANPSPSFPSSFLSPRSYASALASSLALPSSFPSFLLFFHLSFVHNALATSRRTRHQFLIDRNDVAPCFFCGKDQDAIFHIYSECDIIRKARFSFLSSFGFPPSLFYFPLHPPLSFSFLLSSPLPLSKFLLTFNFAVWKFRKPAQASRLGNTEAWLVNRIVDLANGILSSLPVSKAQSKRKGLSDPLADASLHNSLTLGAPEHSAFCYTDGSAMPNPGPAGAGVSFFLPSRGVVWDMGASIGFGSNNLAEMHALGIALSHVPLIANSYNIHNVYIFSDSKLALNSATSKNRTVSNPEVTESLRNLYRESSKIASLHLHWIRGHSAIGGNERVDRISKNFASASSSIPLPFQGAFGSIMRASNHTFNIPLMDYPPSFFLKDILFPPSHHDELDFKHND